MRDWFISLFLRPGEIVTSKVRLDMAEKNWSLCSVKLRDQNVRLLRHRAHCQRLGVDICRIENYPAAENRGEHSNAE